VKRRVIGALFITILVLAVAITPLIATFRPASFDLVYYEPSVGLHISADVLRATLEDQTGLIEGFNVDPNTALSPAGVPTRSLVVSWLGGCDNPDVYMRLIPEDDRYLFVERTSGDECLSDVGHQRTFSIALRAPIDPATVEVVHE
jgi:hypothetical protein